MVCGFWVGHLIVRCCLMRDIIPIKNASTFLLLIYIYIYIYMCVCVCVCKRERERERERGHELSPTEYTLKR